MKVSKHQCIKASMYQSINVILFIVCCLLFTGTAQATTFVSLTNFAYSETTSTILDASGEDSTVTVTASTGARFPSSGEFMIVIYSSTCSRPSTCASREIIRIKSRSSDTFTIKSRNQEGTTHSGDWAIGSKIDHIITKGTIEEITTDLDARVSSIFNCESGDCYAVVLEAGDSLDATAASYMIPWPIGTDCSSHVLEGRVCWDSDDRALYVGNGTSAISLQLGNFIYNTSEIDNGNCDSADTIIWSAGNKQKSTLTGNCTYAFTYPTSGVANLTLKLIQDGTGSRTVTWPGTVKWPGGSEPTLTTTGGAIDIVTCYYDGASAYCAANLDMK